MEESSKLTVPFDRGCDSDLGRLQREAVDSRNSAVALPFSIVVSDKNFEVKEQCRGLPVY